MPYNCDSPEPGHDLPEQLEAFAGEIGGAGSQSGDVAARVRQARDEPELDRFDDAHENDRYRDGRSLDCHSGWRGRRHDDIDSQAHQLFGKPRKLIDAAVGGAELDDHILARNISLLSQALLKAGDIALGRMARTEEPDPVDLPCRLRLATEWRSNNAPTDHSDEPSPVHYWIT